MTVEMHTVTLQNPCRLLSRVHRGIRTHMAFVTFKYQHLIHASAQSCLRCPWGGTQQKSTTRQTLYPHQPHQPHLAALVTRGHQPHRTATHKARCCPPKAPCCPTAQQNKPHQPQLAALLT